MSLTSELVTGRLFRYGIASFASHIDGDEDGVDVTNWKLTRSSACAFGGVFCAACICVGKVDFDPLNGWPKFAELPDIHGSVIECQLCMSQMAAVS